MQQRTALRVSTSHLRLLSPAVLEFDTHTDVRRYNTAYITQVYKVSLFFFFMNLVTGARHHAIRHSPQKSWITNTPKQIQTLADKDADEESSSVSEITMQYLHAVCTPAEHCSLGIRMLGMQWFINSLQIGPKTLKFLPVPLSPLSLCQFVSLPLLNSNTGSSTNNYTRSVSIKHICLTPKCYHTGKQG